jgi:hypothetical protein
MGFAIGSLFFHNRLKGKHREQHRTPRTERTLASSSPGDKTCAVNTHGRADM